MKIAWSQLRHLPVRTQSGTRVGVVLGVEVNTDSHAVAHYEVKPGNSLLGLFSKVFLIAPAQVVSISAEVMVVKNTAVPATNAKRTRLAVATPEAEVEMSELGE